MTRESASTPAEGRIYVWKAAAIGWPVRKGLLFLACWLGKKLYYFRYNKTSYFAGKGNDEILYRYPLTDIGLEKFLKDWEKVPKESEVAGRRSKVRR